MGQALWPEGIGVNQRFWIDDDGQPWLVTATFSQVNDRVEVVGMEVRSVTTKSDPEHVRALAGALGMPHQGDRDGRAIALNSKIWRDVGTLVSGLRDGLVLEFKARGGHKRPELAQVAATLLAPKDRVVARLEEVAEVYNAAKTAGVSTTEAVADRFALSQSAAAKRVQRARQAGLLPPSGRKGSNSMSRSAERRK